MIKPFDVRDIILVANLQQRGLALSMEEQLLHPRSPLRSALLANLFPTVPSMTTFVLNFADENGKTQSGLIQARIRPGRPELDVVFVSPSLESGNGSHAMWQRLLTHLCVKAGEAGQQRIYAHVGNGREDALQIFRNIGFAAYAEETVFKLAAPGKRCAGPLPVLRRQTEADSWSLQRLYAAVTPHVVQTAEGLAQGQWQINNYLIIDQGYRYGYVWENQGEILAVLNFHSGKAGHWFRLMIHPDAAEEAAPLIEAGANMANSRSRRPVFCSLRTYQTEFTGPLSDCGFEPIAGQTLMVKHITVRVKDFLTRLVPAVEAKHATPSMMQSQGKSAPENNGGNHTAGTISA